MLRSTVLAALALVATAPRAPQDAPPPAPSQEVQRLVETFAAQGVHLEPTQGWCSIPIDVEVRDDLLEYLLVGPGGAAHESAFHTPTVPSVLNAALLALGAEPGTNANWKPKEPPPSEEELRAGANAYEVEVPKGDAFFLYVGWRRGDERFFFRMEDLIRNLGTGHSMSRHAWVYLGSRMVPSGHGKDEQAFAADVYQNLICISFFPEGYTLLTGALPECVAQNVWMVNAWLLPDRGARLALFFSRERIERMPREIEALLPDVTGEATQER